MIALKIASIGSFLAGISHLTLQAYDHQSMLIYLAGFIVAGILQMLWAVIAWRGKLSHFWFWFGTLLNLGAVAFWLITRSMPAPFIGEKEHFSLIGYAVAVLEIVAVVGALVTKRSLLHWILVPLSGVGIAFVGYYAGIEAEHHFPSLKVEGGHHHGGGHHKSTSGHNGGGHGKKMDHHNETATSDNHHKKETQDNSDDHHAQDKDHDHAECGDEACPSEASNSKTKTQEPPAADPVAEPAETETQPIQETQPQESEPVVEVETQVEAEAHIEADTHGDDDHHDEPHGH